MSASRYQVHIHPLDPRHESTTVICVETMGEAEVHYDSSVEDGYWTELFQIHDASKHTFEMSLIKSNMERGYK